MNAKRSKQELQFSILKLLKDKPSGLIISQLMSKTNINGLSMKPILDDFIKRGIIVKLETTDYIHNKTRVVKPRTFYTLNLKYRDAIVAVVKSYCDAINLIEKVTFS